MNNNGPRIRRYQNAWNDIDEFRNWLEAVPNDETRARCNLCNREFEAHLTMIRRHRETAVHGRSEYRLNNRNIINQRAHELDVKVARYIMKFSGLYSEHNYAFLSANHLGQLVKEVATDPDAQIIGQMLSFDRKIVQQTVTRCLCPAFKEDLAAKLRVSRFSIQFDETTDISQVHTACIVVTYLNFEKRQIETSLWAILDTLNEHPDQDDAGADAGAARLFNLIRSSFAKERVPFQNIAAYGSDACATMMGVDNSVASRFREERDGIVIVKCPSHAIHLCAEYAMKALPLDIINFCHSVSSYFSRSPNRQHKLIEFQVFLDEEVHKILKPSTTRWLALEACIARILKQWEVLEAYFESALIQENDQNAAPFLDFLGSKKFKCIVYFLNFVLPKVNTLNKFFQRKSNILPRIKENLDVLFKGICGLFLNRNYVAVTSTSDIDIFSQEQFVGIDDVYLGNSATRCMNEAGFDIDDRREIKAHCLDFARVLCSQLRRRFNNFNNNFYDGLACMSPLNALSPNFHQENPDCINLLAQTFRIFLQNDDDRDLVVNEWHDIIFHLEILPRDLTDPDVGVNDFWFGLLNFRNAADETPFSHVAEFFLHISLIPHSNAEPERVWSKLKITKTPLRNKLYTSTCEALLIISDQIKAAGDCRHFEPTERMHDLFRNMNINANQDPNLEHNEAEV